MKTLIIYNSTDAPLQYAIVEGVIICSKLNKK